MTLPKERKFPCSWESCSKTFARACDLSRHYRIHTNERPYPCDVCNKRFNTNSTLKVHKRIHTGEKPFSCDFSGCGRCFAELSTFLRHQRTHRKEKPYFCSYGNCQRWFSRKASLDQHQKRFHSEEVASNQTAAPSLTSTSYDGWPYSDSISPDIALPLDILNGIDEVQILDDAAQLSFDPTYGDTLMHCEPGQPIQTAHHESIASQDGSLNQSMENFVHDTWAFQHQDLGYGTLDSPLHFAPFPR